MNSKHKVQLSLIVFSLIVSGAAHILLSLPGWLCVVIIAAIVASGGEHEI